MPPRKTHGGTGMSKQKHVLICGEVGVGKSTLISRLLIGNARPVYGFVTKRLEAEENGFHPIYIHPAGAKERVWTKENQIGTCDRKTHNINLEVFNTLGVRYLEAEPSGLILMDELGFMEAGAESFVDAVFRALDGDVPVLAAVKARFDVDFLNRVRSHEKCETYIITKENREELFNRLQPTIAAWNAGG